MLFREKVIRLAYTHPHLQDHLVPMLKQGSMQDDLEWCAMTLHDGASALGLLGNYVLHNPAGNMGVATAERSIQRGEDVSTLLGARTEGESIRDVLPQVGAIIRSLNKEIRDLRRCEDYLKTRGPDSERSMYRGRIHSIVQNIAMSWRRHADVLWRMGKEL